MHDCIPHSGYKSDKGYGKQMLDGKVVYAHRIAYCAANNKTLDDIRGMTVRHTCDNPACVNPQHLLIGTHQDNQDDKVLRNRQVKGRDVHTVKLTEDDVRAIRLLHKPRHKLYGSCALGRQYGVGNSTIDRIVKRKIWKHVI